VKKFCVLILVFLILGMAFIGGCAQRSTPSDNRLTIVTSFYPMYVEAINVARDIPGVTVLNMTKAQTGCLHDYQLTPEDLKTLESADVFIINGAGMEAFMTDIISQQAGLDIISASEGIPLIKDAAGNDNPHVWVSVTNAMTQVNTLAAQMADLDPTYASDYAANAAAYNQKLEALKVKMHAALDDIKNRDIITFHEAFPYFAQEFGFRIVAVIEREPGTSPSPKELESTIAIVAQSGVKALFVEPQYPAKAAEAIALETGARLYDLDPAVTGIASPEGYDDYIWIMEQNLAVLEEALK
jgi:zinc transport system substrate-binding protein